MLLIELVLLQLQEQFCVYKHIHAETQWSELMNMDTNGTDGLYPGCADNVCVLVNVLIKLSKGWQSKHIRAGSEEQSHFPPTQVPKSLNKLIVCHTHIEKIYLLFYIEKLNMQFTELQAGVA